MAQTEKTKGELLIELHAKGTSTTIKEISPNGVKLEINDTGQVKGRYDAAHIETVNVFYKTDGSDEWETKAIHTTKEGDFIVIWGNGKGKPAGPTSVGYEGEVHFMTNSHRLSWLNNTTGWIEGVGDNATGESASKVYARK